MGIYIYISRLTKTNTLSLSDEALWHHLVGYCLSGVVYALRRHSWTIKRRRMHADLHPKPFSDYRLRGQLFEKYNSSDGFSHWASHLSRFFHGFSSRCYWTFQNRVSPSTHPTETASWTQRRNSTVVTEIPPPQERRAPKVQARRASGAYC